MARLSLLSDLHFSKHIRWDECLAVHDFIANDIARRADTGEGPDLIVCAGDLTDGATRPDERNALAAFVMKLASIATVVIAYGNHETPGDLDFLQHLRTPNPILVFSSPTTYHHTTSGIALAIMPWIHHVLPAEDARRYNRVAAEKAEHRVIGNRLRSLGDGLDEITSSALDQDKDPPPRVFVGHAMIREAVIRPGQPTRNSRDFLLPLAALSLVRADIYLLGHVHHPQTLATPSGELVVYNGATRPTESGEDGPHGYTLVTFSHNTVPLVERVHVPTTKTTQVTDRWEERNGSYGLSTSFERIHALAKTAHVILNYRVAPDHRAAAKTELDRWQKALAADGLILRTQPTVDIAIRARQPAIAKTRSFAEKLSIWMRSKGKDPDSAEGQRIHQKLANVIETFGIRQTIGGIPRLHRLTIAGINPFTRPLTLDLDALDGDLVAIWGGNGEGKSTILACYSALLYGVFPSPKLDGGQPLQRRALGDEAVIEGEFSTPSGRVRIQHLVDRGSRFIFEDGRDQPIDKSGQVAPFKKWVDDNLLPRSVFHGSLFSAQGDEGIVHAGPAARKSLLLSATGNAALERVKEGANKSKQAAERLAMEKAAIVSATQAQLQSYPLAAENDLLIAEDNKTTAERALSEIEVLMVRSADHEAKSASKTSLLGEEQSALRDAERCKGRRAEIAAMVERREEIRSAADELSRLLRDEATITGMCSRLEVRRAQLRASFSATSSELASIEQRIKSTIAREHAARLAAANEASVAEALSSLPTLSTALSAAEQRVVVAVEDERVARERASNLSRSRIAVLRDGLDSVLASTTFNDVLDVALPADEKDRGLVAGAQADLVVQVEERRRTAETDRRAAELALGKARETAVGEKGVEEAKRALTTALDDRGQEERAKATLEAKLAQVTEEGTKVGREVESAIAERNRLVKRIAEVRPIAAMLVDLERAETLDEELSQQEVAAIERAKSKRAAYDDIRLPSPPPPTIFTIAGREHSIQEAQRILRREIADANIAIGRAREALSKRAQIEARLAEQSRDAATTEREFAEWRFLVDAFGKDGIQALEIDAAAPELSLYSNDLLHEAFGGAYSLELKTQRETDDGVTREDLLINITDVNQANERLAVRDLSEWSGGQRAFLWHAFASSLSLYLAARTPAKIPPTIVRDETAAGVAVASASAYATMLRNAGRAIGGEGTKTLLVTHSRELAEQADVILHLEHGQLHVRRTV